MTIGTRGKSSIAGLRICSLVVGMKTKIIGANCSIEAATLTILSQLRNSREVIRLRKILGKIKNIKGAIIALKKEGGQEMTALLCPVCRETHSDAQFVVNCSGRSKLWGIIQCTRCLHEMPFSMYHDRVQ